MPSEVTASGIKYETSRVAADIYELSFDLDQRVSKLEKLYSSDAGELMKDIGVVRGNLKPTVNIHDRIPQ